jgi:hypothetical protein
MLAICLINYSPFSLIAKSNENSPEIIDIFYIIKMQDKIISAKNVGGWHVYF